MQRPRTVCGFAVVDHTIALVFLALLSAMPIARAQPLRIRAGQRLTWAGVRRHLGTTVTGGNSGNDDIASVESGDLIAHRIGRTTLVLKTANGTRINVALTVTPGELAGTVGAVYLFPSGIAHGGIEPNTNGSWDLGGNSWWMNDWSTFAATENTDLANLRELYDANPRTLLLVYFPLYLADVNYSGTYLDELQTLLQWFNDHGIETMLFIGRPDYHYTGATTQGYADPITDSTQQDYVINTIKAILAHGNIASLVHLVSVYYMGLATSPTQPTADVLAYNQSLKATINGYGPSGASCPGDSQCLEYIQHVDGPFWEAGYNNLSGWNENGYTPADISPANGASDGLMAESWVQGSLSPGLAYLFDNGYFNHSQVMLINDIPNCDDSSVSALGGGFLCATGDHASISAVDSDNAQWFSWLRGAGVGAWSSWDFVDAGSGDVNAYGAVDSAGSTMTENGRQQQRHAGIFIDGFDP